MIYDTQRTDFPNATSSLPCCQNTRNLQQLTALVFTKIKQRPKKRFDAHLMTNLAFLIGLTKLTLVSCRITYINPSGYVYTI